jgi:hypothetical protein
MRLGPMGKKRDANELTIIAALRAVGASVEQLSGTNIPDLLVGYRGLNWLLEVKVMKGELTEGQLKWHKRWGGHVATVRTPEDALRLLGCYLERRSST